MNRMNKVITLFKRDLLSLWRWRTNIYSKLIEPTSYLFIYAITMGSQLGDVVFEGKGISYFSFFMPGILAMQAFYCFSGSLNMAANERRWGLLRSLFLLPVEPECYLFAKALSNTFKILVQYILLFSIAFLCGLISISLSQIFYILIACFLMILFWTALGVSIGVLVKHEQVKSSITVFATLPITLMSSIFYNLNNAPKFIRLIAKINPLDNQVLVVRRAFLQSNYNMIIDKNFLILGISVIATIILSLSIMYRMDLS